MTRRATGTASLLGEVLAALDEGEVRWVLLRGRTGQEVTGRDVDLLVAGDDLGALEDAVFGLGGMALPRALHPWHRFYVLGDPDAGGQVTLDVVTELIYGRELQLPSGLAAGCLERRRRDGALYVLDPTDMFWTVLLHCLLDKRSVTGRRAAELTAALPEVGRPSPGEEVFERLCPSAWSADRALSAVAARDWAGLAALGLQLSPPRPPAAYARPGGTRRLPARARATTVRAVRRAARAVYPVVWRRAGLGVTPHVLDVADGATVDVVVVGLRRRPLTCGVVLLVAGDEEPRLVAAVRKHHYRRAGHGWVRLSRTGIERVRVVALPRPARAGDPWEGVWRASSPVPGRAHCRRAAAGAGPVPPARSSDPRQEGTMSIGGPAGRSRAADRTTPRARPVRVSFSGLDGAGKSRQIDALAAAAGERHAVEVLWLPTKVWPEPLLNRLPPSLRSRLGPKRTSAVADPPAAGTGDSAGVADRGSAAPRARAGVVDAVRSATWLAIATFAAASVGLSLRRRISRSSADLLVLDRYRLDSLVKLQYWYPEVSGAWLSRLVGALAPAPDVEFFLRVDPSVAYARKPEQWSVRQLSRQAGLYDRTANGPLHAVTLDAHEPADDLAREVLSQISPILDGR